MKKIASIAVATVLAVASTVSLSTPSSADPAGAAIAGGVFGFMAGAAMAGAGPHYVYRDSDYGRWRGYGGRWGYGDDWGWHQHVRACFATYPSYDPRQDAFYGRDGRWHRCRL